VRRDPQAAGTGRRGGLPPVAYFGAAGVLGVIAVAVVIAMFTTGAFTTHRAKDAIVLPPDNGVVPTDYSSAPSSAVFAPIRSRTADPKPLTADALFGTKTLADADSHLTLILGTSRLSAQCGTAVWGTALTAKVRQAGCTQAARAVYVDKAGTYAAFVTILNLDSATDANGFVAALDPAGGAGFVTPPAGAPAGFGKGVGVARGLAMGHYAVVSWVQRLTGTGSEQDPTTMSLLITTGRPDAVLSRVVAVQPSTGPTPPAASPAMTSKPAKKK
jgi:hypothetical protein